MDWQAFGAISNAVLVAILVSVTIYYAIQTKKQAHAMDASLHLDRLAKHHERLDREMTKLVGPIHSRKFDEDLFGPIIASKKHILNEIGYSSFWQKIEENMHLTPIADRKYFDDFMYARKYYFHIQETTSPEEAKRQLNQYKGALLDIVDLRYFRLEYEIRRLDPTFRTFDSRILIF